MTVLIVQETGFGKRRVRLGDKYTQDYTRMYRLRTSAPTDSLSEDDLAAAGLIGDRLPQRWDGHPDDPLSLVSEIEGTETEDPQEWEVTVHYSSTPEDPSRQSQDPLEEPPTVSWGSETYQEALQEGYDPTADVEDTTVPVLNAAGDPLEGLQEERHRRVLTYEDNVAVFDDDEADNVVSTINSTTFLGKDSYTWLVREYVNSGRGFKNDQAFFRRRIVLVFDPKTWVLPVLNAGKRAYRVANTPPAVPIRDPATGQQVSEPALLAADGTKLPPGGTPVYLNYYGHRVRDFNTVITGFNTDF